MLFSHGFGVEKDDRGLFTDIANVLDARSVLFNYNQVDTVKKTLTVRPFHEQVEILRSEYRNIRKLYSSAVIDIVCHSQGCVIAALALLPDIRNTILLTPPASMSIAHMMEVFGTRPGSVFNINSDSTIPRRDGTNTIIPPEYWLDVENVKCIELYNRLSEDTNLQIIEAKQDEILSNRNMIGLRGNIKITTLNGDHNFSGASRGELVKVVSTILND